MFYYSRKKAEMLMQSICSSDTCPCTIQLEVLIIIYNMRWELPMIVYYYYFLTMVWRFLV